MRTCITLYLSVNHSSSLCQYIAAGAEVTLESGEKLRGRFVVLADGVHSQTAAKYHKAQLEYMNDIGWR